MANEPAAPRAALPLFTLDPAHAALIVVDMQNDFVREGGIACVPDAKKTIPNNWALIGACRANGVPVVYTRFVMPPENHIWRQYHPAWVAGNMTVPGLRKYYPEVEREIDCADVIDELYPAEGDYVVDKHGYDGFHGTPLDAILRRLGVRYILVSGTVTSMCVEATAKGAYHRNYYTTIVSDAVSGTDQAGCAVVLDLFARAWGKVMTTAEAIAILGGPQDAHRLASLGKS